MNQKVVCYDFDRKSQNGGNNNGEPRNDVIVCCLSDRTIDLLSKQTGAIKRRKYIGSPLKVTKLMLIAGIEDN